MCPEYPVACDVECLHSLVVIETGATVLTSFIIGDKVYALERRQTLEESLRGGLYSLVTFACRPKNLSRCTYSVLLCVRVFGLSVPRLVHLEFWLVVWTYFVCFSLVSTSVFPW